MWEIYLDFNTGSAITFPLDRGPEPEGTFAVHQEGLTTEWRSAGIISPPVGKECNGRFLLRVITGNKKKKKIYHSKIAVNLLTLNRLQSVVVFPSR